VVRWLRPVRLSRRFDHQGADRRQPAELPNGPLTASAVPMRSPQAAGFAGWPARHWGPARTALRANRWIGAAGAAWWGSRAEEQSRTKQG